MFRLHLHLHSFITIILVLIVVYLLYAIFTGQFCHCSSITCDSEIKELKGYFA